MTVDAWYESVSLAFSYAKCIRRRISPSAREPLAAWCAQVLWSVRLLCLASFSKHIWIHWAAASAHACKRVRISPSAPALSTAWCGQETWSLRLLWFALLARHVDPLGCCVSSCMQACVRGSVHELVASARHEAVLHLTANGEHRTTNHH